MWRPAFRRPTLRHPARLVPLTFLAAVLAGTLLLMLPAATTGPGGAPALTALFTATSAVCVTGLSIVDTPTYWSGFGQAIILALFQTGGLGIMTGATLLGLLITRRLRLQTRLVAQAETRSLALADVVGLLRLIVMATLGVELLTGAVLALRLHYGYGEPWGPALWNGLFHGVAAFSNAGYSTYSDNLAGFALDPLILAPIMLAVILGSLGFPVLYEVRRRWRRPERWSVHTKLTLVGTAILLFGGTAAVLLFEWTNPSTLGGHGAGGRLLGAAFHSVMTRSGGFNTVDIADMRPETLAVSYVLMLVGGGSAGTAGGIKVTTFFLLGLVVWSEILGEADTVAFRRRIDTEVQRQALTVALLALSAVAIGVLLLLSMTAHSLEDVIFEVISAFATVGLSTGITDELPPGGLLVLAVLMFLGRVGTITAAAALALRPKQRPFRYPQERVIVG